LGDVKPFRGWVAGADFFAPDVAADRTRYEALR
jgi:hypothetical protein